MRRAALNVMARASERIIAKEFQSTNPDEDPAILWMSIKAGVILARTFQGEGDDEETLSQRLKVA